jgi:hypothetical protein
MIMKRAVASKTQLLRNLLSKKNQSRLSNQLFKKNLKQKIRKNPRAKTHPLSIKSRRHLASLQLSLLLTNLRSLKETHIALITCFLTVNLEFPKQSQKMQKSRKKACTTFINSQKHRLSRAISCKKVVISQMKTPMEQVAATSENSQASTSTQRFSNFLTSTVQERLTEMTSMNVQKQWGGVNNNVSNNRHNDHTFIVDDFILELDPNHDGEITEEEFMLVMKYI